MTDDIKTSDDLASAALQQQQPATPATTDEVAASDEIAATITSLQQLIERHANQLDELQNQIKEYREQMANVFDNDSQLSASQDELQAQSVVVKQHKARLQSDPQIIQLKVKVSELVEHKKEIEETLSNHLVNFFALTNSKSFDTSDGDQREFEIRAKVRGRGRSKSAD